jgi:(1->4)-alpha-D-glucan 1-alpha-D-glucosylmutase
LWDLRLVDPDNRGTVDFGHRIELLADLKLHDSREKTEFAGGLLKNWTDGRIKLYLISKALRCRQGFSKLFTEGDFLAGEISGERSENVTAFFRVFENKQALILAPKWLAGSGMEQNSKEHAGFWANTSILLPDNMGASWHNILTGESITVQSNRVVGLSVGEALKNFPVALLLSNPI